MRRLNKNRVSASDDCIEPRNSFELQFDTSERYRPQRHMNRNLSSDDESSSHFENSEWFQTARAVRRTQSLHRNAFNNELSKMMPSRRNAYFGTVRIKGSNFEDDCLINGEPEYDNENEVQEIVKQIEENDELMEDTPDGEALRIEALRDIPQCLTVKRNVRAKLSASVSRKSKHRPIGFFKRTKYKFSFWWKKMKQNMRDLVFTIELWYTGIRTIEGHFGSGVTTYFRFLRLLFLINLFVSIVAIGFVVLPQALYSNNPDKATESISFSILDIFTGEGSFTNTTMYYGFYAYKIFSMNNTNYYNITAAYFFTLLMLYLFILITLSYRMARSYRKSFIETSSGLKNVYATKVLCGWDFSIATAEAASLKSKSIYNEFKEMLSESFKTKTSYKFLDSIYIFSINFFMHIFVLVLLGLTGLVMWVLMDENINISDVVSAIRVSNQRSILMAVIVTLIIFAFPILFSYIVRFEKYKNPRTPLYVSLLRTYVLEALVVSILCIFWLKSADNQKDNLNKCWETSLGQEIYRLIIFDFFISVIGLPLFEFLRCIIQKHIWSDIGSPEFDIARNTLGLIYNQTLLFLGLFYSPLLPVIVTLKFFITYYVRQFSTLRNCKPSNKSWKAAQMHTVFLLLTFLSLLIILVTLGYVFIKVPIGNCGPFLNPDNLLHKNSTYIYEAVLEEILNIKEENVFFSVIMYFTKPGIGAFILIAMSVAVYYLRAKSLAEKGMVSQLREMLVLQSKDKEFLLNAISRVTEGHWIYNQKPNTSLDRSTTWRFAKDRDSVRKPSNANYQFGVNSPDKRSIYNETPNIPMSSMESRRNYENVQIHH